MLQIDTHLAGRRANVDALCQELHRLLQQHHAVRVEVRYSSQCREHFDNDLAFQKITQLLRAHGQGAASVSVRRHACAQAEASRTHLLRLLPSMQQPDPPLATAGWRAWLPLSLRRWQTQATGIGEPLPARPEPTADGTWYPKAGSAPTRRPSDLASRR